MQIATYLTPSHMKLYSLFVQTISEFDNIVTYWDSRQICDGTWGHENWTCTLHNKARAMRKAVHTCKDELMVWSDVDVVFRRPVVDRLTSLMDDGQYDLLAQSDGGSLCAGFFVVRINDRTKRLFDVVANHSPEAYTHPLSDQRALNNAKHIVKSGVLSLSEFWTPGYHDGVWSRINESTVINPPDTWRVAHVNWCVGTKIKFKIMCELYEKYIRPNVMYDYMFDDP